jgi:hypothetical protein
MGAWVMKSKSWIIHAGIGLVFTGLMISSHAHAGGRLSDGYTLEDYRLRTANDLVDVCTTDAGHPDHMAAMAFCYGFFEGAARYDEALVGSHLYKDVLCEPPDATRAQAVDVFVQYITANPQYGTEPPIDAVFRALTDKWPCEE